MEQHEKGTKIDFYIATAKESLTQIEVANKFLEVTEKYCLERIDRELDK